MKKKKAQKRTRPRKFQTEFMLVICEHCGHGIPLRIPKAREPMMVYCFACEHTSWIDPDDSPPLRKLRAVCPCCETVSDYWIMDGGEVVSYRCRYCKAPVDTYWDKGAKIYRAPE